MKRLWFYHLPIVLAVFSSLANTACATPSTNAGGTEPLALSVFATGPAVGRDTRGYLELFTRNDSISQNSQAFAGPPQQGYFSPAQWAVLSNSAQTLSDPVVVTNQAGALDVFYVSQNLTIWHSFQTGYNVQGDSTWSPLYQMDGIQVPAALLQGNTGTNSCGTTTANTTSSNAATSATSANANTLPQSASAGVTSPSLVLNGGNPVAPVNVAQGNNAPANSQGLIVSGGPVGTIASCTSATASAVTLPTVMYSTPASNVAAVLSPQGLIYLFYIGVDGGLWEISQNNINDEVHWNVPASFGIGGTATGHPTVAVSGGTIYVFYYSNEVDQTTGNRGAIYYLFGNGAAMTPPIKINTTPSITVTYSNIVPAVNTDGRVELFYRGAEEGLWHIWQTSAGTNSAWSAPQQLSETGGIMSSDPVAVMNTNNLMQVFYRGTEGDIWTVVKNTDDGGAGQWSCRSDLVNSISGRVDSVASPIALGINQTDDPGALQLFYVGAINTNNGGSINNALVDAGQVGTAAPTTPTSANDIWTLLQVAAGSNPACPQNDSSGWTVPATIGGTVAESISYPVTQTATVNQPNQPAIQGPLF